MSDIATALHRALSGSTHPELMAPALQFDVDTGPSVLVPLFEGLARSNEIALGSW